MAILAGFAAWRRVLGAGNSNGPSGWHTFIRGFSDVVAALKSPGVTKLFQVTINP